MYYQNTLFQGNSGGPLVCEGEVMGLQTYIDGNCKQPHLYQLLSSWDNFITCGIEDKCQEEQCAHICDVINKDPLKTDSLITSLSSDDNISSSMTTTTALPETITPEGDILKTSTDFVTEEEREIVTETTSTTTGTQAPTLTPGYSDTTETVPWPKEKTDERKNLVDDGEEERKANVEAQQQSKKSRSATERNMCFVQTIVFGLVLCLF